MTGSTPPPAQAPSITAQPGDQTVPLGQTATFTVTATGTAPLTYQWSENGATIQGATSASYVTPVTGLGDNGATFTVMVSNAAGSVTSRGAALTLGPRSPKTGDLRFQLVDAPATSSGLTQGYIHSDVFDGLGQFFGNISGTPLSLGDSCTGPPGNPQGCVWFFSTFFLPGPVSGINTNYQGFRSASQPVDQTLDSLASTDSVVTSLDLELNNLAWAASWVEDTSTTGLQYAHETIAPAQFQDEASRLGAQSRVITALSFDQAGQIYFLHYGWQGDTTTVYEAKAVAAAIDDAGTEATNLANEGYIITALGGNSASGFVLVGTRVQGDTLPRPIMVLTPQSGLDLDPLLESGDAIVGYLLRLGDNELDFTWIGER